MASSRWDPEMAAFQAMMEERGKALPPLRFAPPLDESRAVTEALNLPLAEGGPRMAESADRWLPVRGRRLLCRVHRPTIDRGPLPVLVYVHGGGWVWNSIDTHDRLMREYAAAAGCAVAIRLLRTSSVARATRLRNITGGNSRRRATAPARLSSSHARSTN